MATPSFLMHAPVRIANVWLSVLAAPGTAKHFRVGRPIKRGVLVGRFLCPPPHREQAMHRYLWQASLQ